MHMHMHTHTQVRLLFSDYMSTLRTADPVAMYVPYVHNSLALSVAAVSVHITVIQLLSFIPERPRRCACTCAYMHGCTCTWSSSS